MEWNARAQLTTWHPTDAPTNPTPPGEGNEPYSWPGNIDDYARKQVCLQATIARCFLR